MAALRFFTRSQLCSRVNPTFVAQISKQLSLSIDQDQNRTCHSYPRDESSTTNHPDYEISRDPEEWKYVERLIVKPIIPPPPSPNARLPSGFKPRKANVNDYPYFLRRSRNHMPPIYLNETYRGMRKITEITHIEGDIWALKPELKNYLENITGRPIGMQVNEITGMIRIRGDYVSRVIDWFYQKGF